MSAIGTLTVSGTIDVDQPDADNLRVSAFSDDAGTFHVSAVGNVTVVQTDAVNLDVSAKSLDGGTLRVSAIMADASNHRISAIQADASNLDVSAKSDDAALLRSSAIQGDASNLMTSAILQPDAATKLSMFATSAGIAQLSAIKGSKGNLYGYQLGNRDGTDDQWLSMFNAATVGAVTLGTTVPDKEIFVPAGGGANLAWSIPPTFSNGIVVAVVSAPNGATAATLSMTVSLDYL